MLTHRGTLLSAALPLLLVLLLSTASASAAQNAAAAAAAAATAAAAAAPNQQQQKPCCAALLSQAGFEAAATGPVPVPVLIITLPAPGLPAKKNVEVVGRLCECGVGAGEEKGVVAATSNDDDDDDDDDEQPWVALKVRGSTSARDFAKKSFALNFVSPPATPGQQPKKGSAPTRPPFFLGMPMADGKFALGAVGDDRTLGARSSLTFDAFRVGMGRWAPRTRRAELFVRVEPAAATAIASPTAAVAASAETAPLLLPTAAATTPAPIPLQYRGVYLATERVTRAKARVDVAAYKPPTTGGGPSPTTGGFLVAYENDNVAPGEPIFAARASRLTFVVEDPSSKLIANASAAGADPLVYLTDFFNGMERALLAPGPLAQPIDEREQQKEEPRATIAAAPPLAPFLDVAAAADYFLLTELTKNPDGYRGSIKMHKNVGKPLVIGTPWDYGEAYGSCCGFPLEGYKTGGRSGPGTSGGSAISPNGWRFNICADPGRCLVEPADGTSQYFRRLWQDGAFRAGVASRWRQLRQGALNDTFFAAAIEENERALGASSGAAGRNFALWAAELPARPEEMIVLEKAGGAGVLGAFSPPPPPAQFVAANLALRSWVLARLAWMDRALGAQADPAAPADAYLAATTTTA